jgi:hypothetical protein
MFSRFYIGLFAVAVLIFANDALGWGILPLTHHNEYSLSDLANAIMSPAYKIVQNQTGIDVNPSHTFAEVTRILATR